MELQCGSSHFAHYTNFTYNTVKLDKPINLDLYNSGIMTIGYIERHPIVKSGSYLYKNSLNARLNYFKVFNSFKSFCYGHRSDFENFTKNDKYYLNDKIYHNKNLDICKVNWLIEKNNKLNISKVDNIELTYKNI